MTQAIHCPQCGVSLDADALHGLCPSCLLEEGLKDSASGEWSREPLTTTSYGVNVTPPEVADLARHFP